MVSNREPIIIQGGMGAAVSAWQLARAVSLAGQLGVVSGTAIDVVLARRLQLGDPGGHMRRALAERLDSRIRCNRYAAQHVPVSGPRFLYGCTYATGSP